MVGRETNKNKYVVELLDAFWCVSVFPNGISVCKKKFTLPGKHLNFLLLK